jgi:spermidine/putrescine-binding protein
MNSVIYVKDNDMYFSHFDEYDNPVFKKKRKYMLSITSTICSIDLRKMGYDTIILSRGERLSKNLKELL